MFNFIVKLLKAVFSIVFKKRKDLIFTLLLLKKENEIMQRHLNLNSQRITSNHKDRLCLSLIAALSKRSVSHLTIVRPETLLEWQRRFIKKRWSYKHKKRGRKPVSAEIRALISHDNLQSSPAELFILQNIHQTTNKKLSLNFIIITTRVKAVKQMSDSI